MRDESNDDKLVDAVLLELQVQVGVGEATGTPVLLGNNLTWRRHEFGSELATPCAVFEGLVLPCGSLNRRDVGPGFVVARTVSMMHGVEDAKLRRARGVQDLQHVRNAAVCLSHGFDARPDLA